jgi:1,4-dihydroxy-2-naphthoate octaprenyltransferase
MLILVSAAIGVYLASQVGLIVLGFGLAGAFAGYFYTAPPLRLVARHGIGELAIGITFGPLITGGIFATITGEFSWMSMLIGLPIGLLTSNILLINQVPDMEGDASTGKNHLVVTFGKENSVIIYAITVAAAVGTTLTIAFKLHNMWLILPMVLLGVYGAYIVSYFRKHVHARTLVTANVNTVQLAMIFGIAFAIAIAV